MKKYNVTIFLDCGNPLVKPRFELVIEAKSSTEAKKKAIELYKTLNEDNIKYDKVILPFLDVAYIDVQEEK